MKKKSIISIFLIVIFTIVIGFVLLDIPRDPLHFLSLEFFLISLLMILLLSTKFTTRGGPHEPLISLTSFSFISCIYSILVITLTWLTKIFENRIKLFIFLHIALLAIYIISLIIVAHFSKAAFTAHEKDHDTVRKQSKDAKRGEF